DLSEFYKIARKDSILKNTLRELYGMKPYFAGSVFERALLAICLQMVHVKRRIEMLRSFILIYGEQLTFDGKTLRNWPSPSRLRTVLEEELKEKCKLGYRAKFIHRLAELKQLPDIAELWKKPTDEALKELTRLPGIGEYSAGIILTKNTFPIDVWSSSIFHKLFFGKAPEKPREVIKTVIEEAERRYNRWKWEAFAYTLNALPKLELLMRKKGEKE
ncbi:MAG: DNA-3-methyladenine glycosylase family protein, partial [Candidatus Freyarchaeota archaeon]